MNPLVDIGKDGQCILWQPHLLTELLADHPPDALALEPSLNPAGVSRALFGVETDDVSVKWVWGHWKRVEITAESADGTGAPRGYVCPRPASARWSELSVSGAVELTFYGANDEAGGSVKVEVPDAANFGRDVEFGASRGGEIVVRLLNTKNCEDVTVERLRLTHWKEFKPKGVPIAFRSGQTQLSVPVSDDFFGIIAVVRNVRRRRHLVGYVEYNGKVPAVPNLSRALDAEKFRDVRRWVEGEERAATLHLHQDATLEEWLDNWPSVSRRRLNQLLEEACRRANLTKERAYKVLRAHPTGLLRYLALSHCGYQPPGPESLIRLLDKSDFMAALNGALPGLGGALSRLGAPEERAWAVRHAGNPNLADAVASAAGQGVSALERALHLLDRRSEARASWEARRGSPSAAPP
jgi:hypothetical protein